MLRRGQPNIPSVRGIVVMPTGIGDEIRWWCPSTTGDTSSMLDGGGAITLGGAASVLIDAVSGNNCIAMNGNGGGSFAHTALDTTGVTLNYWVRSTGLFTFFFNTSNSGSNGIYSQSTFRWRAGGNIVHAPSSSTSAWTMMTWSWADDSLSYYVNGVLVSLQSPGNRDTSISYLNNNTAGTVSSFLRYDDIRVLSRSITAAEVTTLYNGGVPGYGYTPTTGIRRRQSAQTIIRGAF